MGLKAVAVFIGSLLLHQLALLPSRGWGWVGLLVALLLLRCKPPLPLLAWIVAGFCWALVWSKPFFLDQLPLHLTSKDVEVSGWVATIPRVASYNTRFQFAVDTLKHEGVRIPFDGDLQLSWYAPYPALRVGERWQLTVRLKRPRGWRNPGGFDYERWLYLNGIAAQGYVRAHPPPRRLDEPPRYPLQRLRQAIAERFAEHLSASPYAGVLIALAVGERGGIENWQWEVFSRTGTSHLLAISGLHVGMVAGLVFVIVRWLWSRVPMLVLRWPAIKAAALAALLGAGGYTLLAGLSLPTRRAFIMVAVVTLALLAQRPVTPSRVLAVALLAVLLLESTAPLSGGFWLSFGAVATILYYTAGRSYAYRSLGQWIGLQLAIAVALLPVTLMLFQRMSLLAPVANLIAIPWVSVTVVPLTLLGVIAGGVSELLQQQVLRLAALSLDWLWQFLLWLSTSSWSELSWPAPPLWTLAFMLPGLALLLAPPGFPGRWLGAVLYLPVLYFPVTAPTAGETWFTLLDVGDGLAAVVRTADHVMVYDTGPRRSINFDAGQAALVPFLRQQGITRVDVLIISHGDNAHMGGTRALRSYINVERILTASPSTTPIAGAQPCRAGMAWNWDGVQLRLLHPSEGEAFSGDDASCVLMIENDAGRILVPGDIEAPAMRFLTETYGSALKSQVLVAPHQGTRQVFSPAFVAAVQPRYVVFSSSARPRRAKAQVLAAYRDSGAVVLDTAHAGAITLRLQQGKLEKPERYRHRAERYWHSALE